MSDHPSAAAFDDAHAARYDERFAALAPIRDALHFLTAMALRDLPEDARVLCAGAGTGAELLALAARYPGWRFVAVDPSAPMLAVCRRRTEAAGISHRCEFHEGYVSDLPAAPRFHAATSLLVSQFITDTSARIAYFRDLATRLLPGGRLVTADLSTGTTPDQHDRRVAIWRAMLEFSGVEPRQIEDMLQAWQRDVAISTASDIEALLLAAGFTNPVLISQTLLIHAWLVRRSE